MNIFEQVDPEGDMHVLFDKVIDHCTGGANIKLADSFTILGNVGQGKIQTTEGWEILVKQKDGSSVWEELKDTKKLINKS